jgi:UDP-N-acetylglucosamine--N-acetylmuramyl-(pentapeptide) pyrophosphoryl-undecaprenol N-acetylglucosamine transferase
VVIHESDITPGLANRLAFPFARRVCVNFPETLARVPKSKGVLTGSPIWEALFNGDRFMGRELCGFTGARRPTVLITGGSTGAAAINRCVREALPRMLKKYNVIHLCGKGNMADVDCIPGLRNMGLAQDTAGVYRHPQYAQFEYVTDELPHLLALADMVVSRAGANTINELLALRKPNLLIPLTREASRGDQILNAESFRKQGFSAVLPETEMTADVLLTQLEKLYEDRHIYIAAMKKYWGNEKQTGTGTCNVLGEILKCAGEHTPRFDSARPQKHPS